MKGKKTFICLVGYLVIASAAIFASGGKDASGTAPATAAPAATAVPSAFREAPMLAAKVTAGQLPAVTKRLPAKPLVIKPYEQVGVYGGIIRMAHRGPSDSTGYYRTVREPLVNYDEMLKNVNPNLAETWTVSPDGKVITFKLRDGLKWSDGKPFTADDIMFWWEVMNTKELYPALPAAYMRGGQPVSITKVDSLTVRMDWAVPQAAYINWVAAGGDETYMPKHYLSQFHKAYASEADLTAKAKAEGLTTWAQLFQKYAGTATNMRAPNRPTMDAWFITNAFDAPILVSERNPYYFKVDTAGNQLPYVDFLHRKLVSDIEVMKLQLMAGEIDYITRHLWTTYGDLPLYTANQQRGDYRIIRTHGGTPGALNLYFNVNYKEDPAVAAIINNFDFKKALSYAIDRDEINDARFNGLGTPSQGHFISKHPGYVESVDKAFTELKPAESNKLLDSIGMNRRDSEGFRLRPDGKSFTLIIDGSTHHLHHAAGGELIKSYFEAVGIRTVINMMERGLFETKRQGNGSVVSFHEIADPLIPLEQTGHIISYPMAPLWDLWFQNNGTKGEEPSADAKRIMQIYRELAPATGDDAKRAAYVKEISEIWGRNLWTIGTVGVPFNLSFAKNKLRNIPADGAHSHPANPGVYRPYQWYWQP